MRMQSGSRDYLFRQADMFSVIEHQRRAALTEVGQMEPNRLLNTPTEDLVGYIVEKYRLDVPVIDREGAVLDEPQETTIPMNDFGRQIEARATAYTLTVPFSGDSEMFKVQPTTYDSAPPTAMVHGPTLILTVVSRSASGDDVKRQLNGTLDDIERYLGWQRGSAGEFNGQLPGYARNAVEGRKAQLLKDRNIAADLGFKMRPRADAATFAAPQVRRKVIPAPPPASATPYKPEPVLDEANYQHILKVIENMTHVMERSPTAFAEMGEEDIRQHFLVQLNGHFEGQATGETFNHQGKTDILIRSQDRNIFIAECKFWRGEKAFAETIDQVLGYLSWRDMKAAIVLFNRNKGFSEVLTKIRGSADAHANRKRGPDVQSETRLRYVFGNPRDSSREIILTIMAFDVPS